MGEYGEFLIVGQSLFVTFVHKNNRRRSFTYSGILDIECSENGCSLVINHVSTQIIINGSGLDLLHTHILNEDFKSVYEDKNFKGEDGTLHKITDLAYLDEKSHE